MATLQFGRWDSNSYMLRQDELQMVVDILNTINSQISGGTLVVPDCYKPQTNKLKEIDWTITDGPPITRSGEVIFSNHLSLIFI